MADAFNCGCSLEVFGIERMQCLQNMHRTLQCIGATIWNSSMRHLTLHRHFHLQTAVVGCNHLIAKTRCDHQVGFGVSMF